jgi:TPR repeat protein
VPRGDPKESEMWLRRAAQSGFRRAQVRLAKLVFEQDRFEEWPEAMRLIEDAASDFDDAKLVLAQIRIYGTYRQRIDLDQGEKLLRELAEKGVPDACAMLGEAYLTGLWLPKDPVTGVRLLKAAAEAGNARAQDLLRLHNYLREHPRDNDQR